MYMQNNDLFRLSFISSNSSNISLKNNLRRIVYSIFYKKNNYQYSCSELLNLIRTEYDLEFSTQELNEAIANDSSLEKVTDNESEKYRLTIKKYQEILTTERNKSLPAIIKKYLLSFENKYDVSKVEKLITGYLFQAFNKNKNAILQLLGKENTNDIENYDYSDDEKLIINDFLIWDDEDKNHAIYNAISYCVDYCMLTTKKDVNSFKNIFSGKKFYLDANVILRLIGFNNQERQKILQSFIKRCRDVGIELRYSNFTLEEAKTTIEYYVEQLCNINKDYRILSQRQTERYLYNRKDIITLYNNWVDKNYSSYNDYPAFAKYLIKEVESVIRACKLELFKNQKLVNEAEYSELFNSLKYFKESRNIQTYDNSIEIDINNFITIKNYRENEKGDNIFNLNNYLISTDSKLCEWNKELFPGVTPICILPSTWYSMILKLCGRSDNDYKAFTSFLNMRYQIEPNSSLKKKEEIIRYVQSLEEPKYIKEKILDKIYELIRKPTFVYEPKNIVEQAEIEVENEEIERISTLIGNDFKEQGKLSLINKMIDEKLDRKYCVINFLKSKLPCIVSILNWIEGVMVIILVVMLIFPRFDLTRLSTYFLIDSYIEGFIKIRNIQGLLAVIIFSFTWAIIKPLLWILNKFNREEDFKKFQDKMIKKYLLKNENTV